MQKNSSKYFKKCKKTPTNTLRNANFLHFIVKKKKISTYKARTVKLSRKILILKKERTLQKIAKLNFTIVKYKVDCESIASGQS